MGAIKTELLETGERRGARGQVRHLVAQRIKFVRVYQSSGLTMAAFARREGLKYSTFAGWVLKGAAGGGACRERGVGESHRPPTAAVRFAEVQLPQSPASTPTVAPGLEVRFPDGVIARGVNAAELAALVRALRS